MGAYACSSSSSSSSSSKLSFVGTSGVDTLGDLNNDIAQTVNAGDGNDRVYTADGDDDVRGGEGDDIIRTNDGDDVIRGGTGNDDINAGAGNDTILIVGTTVAADGYTASDVERVLSSVLPLSALMENTEDEAGSDNIDGGLGYDSVVIYGTVDLSNITIRNVETVRLHSEVTIDTTGFGSATQIIGDGTSKIIVNATANLSAILNSVTSIEGVTNLEIADGEVLTVDNANQIAILEDIGIISGTGTLAASSASIGGMIESKVIVHSDVTIGLNITIADITYRADYVVSVDESADVIRVDTSSISEGIVDDSSTNDVDEEDTLIGYSMTQTGDAGFSLNATTGELTARNLNYEDNINKYVLTFTKGSDTRKLVVLVNNVVEFPTQEQVTTQTQTTTVDNGGTPDDATDDVTTTVNDFTVDESASTRFNLNSLLDLDSSIVLVDVSSSTAGVTVATTDGGFTYNSGDFYREDTVRVTYQNLRTGEQRVFDVKVTVTSEEDTGEMTAITGIGQVGQTLSAGRLSDVDGKISEIAYQWLRGSSNTAITGATSSTYQLQAADEDQEIKLKVTYKDGHGDSSEAITVSFDDTVLAATVDTNLNVLSGDTIVGEGTGETLTASGSVVVVDPTPTNRVEDELKSITFGDGAPVTLANNGTGSVTGAYGSLALATNGVWTYTLAANENAYELLDVDEVETEVFTFTTNEGVKESLTITVVGVNEEATATGTAMSITDLVSVNNNLLKTGTFVIDDADGTEQESFISEFNIVADSGMIGTTAINVSELSTYGKLNVLSDGAYHFVQDSGIDALEASETAVLKYTITTYDGTELEVTITAVGANDRAVFTSEATVNVAEGTAITEIIHQLEATDAEGGDLTYALDKEQCDKICRRL